MGLAVSQLSLAEKFSRDGYVSPLDVISTAEARSYARVYDELESDRRRRGVAGRPTQQHLVYEPFWELATRPRVLELITAAIGPDVVMIATGFFSKSPGDCEKYVAWHQDTTYWGLDPPFAATLWIAIDDSDVENGCLRVIPGTHRGGILPHGKATKAGNILGHDQEIDPAAIDESHAVDLVLKAGQASLHHGMTVHGSNPNLSHRRRCGMTVRFTTPDVRPVPGVFTDKPILVGGKDPYGHFEYVPRPVFNGDSKT